MIKKILPVLLIVTLCLGVVSDQADRKSYPGNGSSTAFTYTFPTGATSDLEVKLVLVADGNEVATLSETTHYTATSSESGGTVTTVTFPDSITHPLTSSYEIHIRRVTPKTQTLNLQNGVAVNLEDLEDAHDKTTKIAVEAHQNGLRTIRFPSSSDEVGVLTPISDFTGKFLFVNASNQVVGADSTGGDTPHSVWGAGWAGLTTSSAGLTELYTIDHVLTSDHSGDVDVAIAAMDGNSVLIIDSIDGAAVLSESKTLTANQKLVNLPGCYITGTGSPTLTINGHLEPTGQFVDPATVTLAGSPKIDKCYVDWFGTNTTPGTTDMTVAIQAAIDAYWADVYFLPMQYLTTSAIILPSTDGETLSLYGGGREYNVGLRTRITANHAGNVLEIHDTVQSGIIVQGFEFRHSAGHAYSGYGISMDGTGALHDVDSHITIKNTWCTKNAVGVYMRGVIYGTLDHLSCNDNTIGLHFDGQGYVTPQCNMTTINNYLASGCTYGIYYNGDPGRNHSYNSVSVESNTTGIYIDPNTSLQNLEVTNIWFENMGSYCIDARGGFNLTFNNVRLGDTKPLFRPDTFGATKVIVNKMFGGSTSVIPGSADITVNDWTSSGSSYDNSNVTASKFNRSFGNDFGYSPTIITGKTQSESTLDVVRQSGILSRNWLRGWDFTTGSWSITGTAQQAAGPYDVNDAWEFTSTGGIADGVLGAAPSQPTGTVMELACWAKGTGRVELATTSDGTGFHKVFTIDVPHWVRLVARYIDGDDDYADDFVATVTQAATGDIQLWRPGLYAVANSIDTRPLLVETEGAVTYEGTNIDFDSYGYGERERYNLIVYDTAAPTAGSWLVGDRCKNTSISAGDPTGWVCTVAGTPGTWKAMPAIDS